MEPKYLSVLHEVESKYGSISNAPPEEVDRVQKAAGVTNEVVKRPTRERGDQWKQFLRELDTEKMTSYEILMAARKDECLSKNWHISIGAVYHAMKKYGIKYKKMSEV
ncbi:hypothetical protein [Levilactobacillus namurensis]|uniref:Transcriptional regulator n=1 Tax=Levilactobacillus namurensis TaxID=380393 RepID=A0AAW8W9C7_9LACO|nr:hypothetical protein [Levilactobacillus namurensis]MDT7015339.1 hypothetical protein [Levilactobacillus namurensis]